MDFKRYLGTFLLTGGFVLSSLPLLAKLETTGLLIKVKPIVPSIIIKPPSIKINPPWGNTGIRTSSGTQPDMTTQLCNQCDPSKKSSSNIQCQNVDGNKVVSRCTSENSVTYISCGSDGKNTVNVSSCGEGEVCTNGACRKNSCSATPASPETGVEITGTREGAMPTDEGDVPVETSIATPTVQPTCNNSYDASGTVTGVSVVYSDGTTFTFSDFCTWKGEVAKYQCDGNQWDLHAEICPSGTICKDGTCVGGSYTCTDTDPNNSMDVQGVISVTTSDGETFSEHDLCSFDGWVGQLQCAGNHLELNWQACRNGTICINGTCQTGTCTDTDPNNDLEVRGTVSITDANGESWYSDNDSCSDDQTVVEYSCDGAYFTDRSYNCEAGKICNAGACQTSQASCTDTDPTNNENVKGTASGTFSNGSLFSWDDFCSANGERLVQANCVNNRPFDIVQQCTYGCKDGACQPPPCLCTDSDPQNDPRVAGEAVDIDGVGHHDYCNGKQLIQFACTEKGMAASKNTFCIGGCLNGACR